MPKQSFSDKIDSITGVPFCVDRILDTMVLAFHIAIGVIVLLVFTAAIIYLPWPILIIIAMGLVGIAHLIHE